MQLVRGTRTQFIGYANSIRKARNVTRYCSKQLTSAAWKHNVIWELSTQLGTGPGCMTRFLQPIGIDVRLSEVTQMHSTTWASCTYAAKGSKLILTQVCNGCGVQLTKGMSFRSGFLPTFIGTATTVSLRTQHKPRFGMKSIVGPNSIA